MKMKGNINSHSNLKMVLLFSSVNALTVTTARYFFFTVTYTLYNTQEPPEVEGY